MLSSKVNLTVCAALRFEGSVLKSSMFGQGILLGSFYNGFGNTAMDTRHGKKMEVLDGNPSSLPCSVHSLAVINMEGEFEVGIGLSESSDKLFYFDIQPRFFLDVVS